MKKNFKVVGMMSGTSMDGLDIVLCDFTKDQGSWSYTVMGSSLVKYPASLARRLAGAAQLSGADLMALDADYGEFLGNAARKFLEGMQEVPDFIASHGHTVFHQPQKGFTLQIGNPNALHASSGLPVIADFRSLDVALGGQGAPLVPIGDALLFAPYDICLNLGGIANLSSGQSGERNAFDICFCNMPLNYLMNTIGKKYDGRGERASKGKINPALLEKMKGFYRRLRKSRPSLGRELFEESMVPLISSRIPLEDKLATVVESTAMEIADAAKETGGDMLCTGGGVFNSFLMSRILHHCGDDVSVIVPDDEVVKFKEAIVFAFLGVLRFRGDTNCLKSVTGASRDSSGGIMVGF